MKTFLFGLLGTILLIVFMYGGVVLTKNISYNFFYKKLVQSEIKMMVKKESLRHGN